MEGLSVKSNSICAVNVKLRSALQHALNFPPKLACKHPVCCHNQPTSKDPMLHPVTKLLTFLKPEKRQTSTYLGDGYFRRIMRLNVHAYLCKAAKLIRIPLSRLQLDPVVDSDEVVAQFRQIRLPSSKLYRVLNCKETVEPFVFLLSFKGAGTM